MTSGHKVGFTIELEQLGERKAMVTNVWTPSGQDIRGFGHAFPYQSVEVALRQAERTMNQYIWEMSFWR